MILPLLASVFGLRSQNSAFPWKSQGAVPVRAPRNRLRFLSARKLRLEPLETRALLSVTMGTDKPGYAPGETVKIVSGGFPVGDVVNLQVLRGDGTTYPAWSVTDGVTGDGAAGDGDGLANGSITTSWVLPADSPGNTYTVTATDLSSGQSAQATFQGLAT